MIDWGEVIYENYIKMFFVWVCEVQLEVWLYINDYGVEFFNSLLVLKNCFLCDQVKVLKDCGVLIDVVGF